MRVLGRLHQIFREFVLYIRDVRVPIPQPSKKLSQSTLLDHIRLGLVEAGFRPVVRVGMGGHLLRIPIRWPLSVTATRLAIVNLSTDSQPFVGIRYEPAEWIQGFSYFFALFVVVCAAGGVIETVTEALGSGHFRNEHLLFVAMSSVVSVTLLAGVKFINWWYFICCTQRFDALHQTIIRTLDRPSVAIAQC